MSVCVCVCVFVCRVCVSCVHVCAGSLSSGLRGVEYIAGFVSSRFVRA